MAFSEHAADVLLLETGLGGRLDATNVVAAPLATVITPIDFDHMEFLGGTLGLIAAEKAGIMKASVPCFVGAQQAEAREVLKRHARVVACPITLHGHDWAYAFQHTHIAVEVGKAAFHLPQPALAGVHQHHNAALAAVVAHALPALPVTGQALEAGVRNAVWPARLQRLTRGPLVEAWGERGTVVLDGGHNPSAAMALYDWIGSQHEPVTLVLGMMKRKDAEAFLRPLAGVIAQLVCIPIADNDAYAPEDLASAARSVGIARARTAPTLDHLAFEGHAAPGALLIAGSLFLAGEVLKKHS
jgi:dihydrofolate synthase/folylpolyglutamate synthase